MKSTTSSYHFTPDIDYKFPCEGGHGFLHWYLKKYSWLTYSWQENGGYYLPCVLFARSIDIIFARSIDIRKGKGVFVETAFTNFKKMYEVCDLHAAREYHKDAIAVFDAFVERMNGKRESVLIQLREGVKAILNNRKKFCSITEIIVLSGRQNMLSVVIMIVA